MKNKTKFTDINCYDQVKHGWNNMMGVVIAKYMVGGKEYFDVQGVNDKIYYRTPATDWKLIRRGDDEYV